MKKIIKIIQKIKNFILYHKIIIGINYHRVGKQNKNDPFEQLHTVSFNNFKIQIKLIKYLFNIVSLEDLRKKEIKKKINFFITFDDVPKISKTAFQWLEKENIAFSICPNISVIENQFNIGDKIRFAINESKKIDVTKKIEDILDDKDKKLLKQHGLRKFYKLYNVDQLRFKKKFNDFFSKELNKNFSEYGSNQYLTWQDIANLSEYVEIVSHGLNHDNFFHLDYNEISDELEKSKKIFLEKVNLKIKVFALPYGEFNQDLGILVNELAKKFDYKQVLWVGNQGIIYSGKQKNKIQNLTRINAPKNLISFLKTIIYSFLNSSVLIHENRDLKKNYDNKFNNSIIEKNSELKKITSFENIIRPDKDYSSDEKYIKNIYIDNPFRDDLPYNFSLIRNNVISAIHYNLYKNYIINKNCYKILESSGWRKIESIPANINGTLLLRALKTCKSIYSWRPSKYLSPAYKKSNDFFTIYNSEFIFKSKKYNIEDQDKILITDHCPEYIDNFLKNFNQKFYFTLERSTMFYKWRIDNYPLGEKKYFIKKNKNEISSFLVSQILHNKAMIVDLLSRDIEENIKMIQIFLNYCVSKKIYNIKFSTSCKSLIERINQKFKCKVNNFESFIYVKKLIKENIIERELLNKNESYETYVSGDVLIR